LTLKPDKTEVIRQKFFGIEGLAFSARHLSEGEDERLKKFLHVIDTTVKELDILVKTKNEDGKKWGNELERPSKSRKVSN
jgi:hypothetical protein